MFYKNGELVDSNIQMGNYTSYPSSFLVVDPDGIYSKHYYAGTQRIAARMGQHNADELFEDKKKTAKLKGTDSTDNTFNPEELKTLQQKDLQLYLDKAGKVARLSFKKYKSGESEVQEQQQENENNYVAYGAMAEELIYYYHPDHLGTATYLTDINGEAYEFFLNLPFGETMAEQHSQTADYVNRWKFTGHELDRETGLYYANARYYDPRTSIFLSVDPLAEKFPSWSPYTYCYNNPVIYVDPDGENPILGAIVGAFTEYASIVGSRMIFDNMTFKEANSSLNWQDALDITIAAGFGAASGALDGGITKFASWVSNPKNQKILIKLLEVGVSAIEGSLKQIYKDEEFDLMGVLSGALAEVGMGSLLKTDAYKEVADRANLNANVSTKRAEDLASRKSPNQKLINNATEKAAEETRRAKAFEKLDATGKVIEGTISKTTANKVQDELGN